MKKIYSLFIFSVLVNGIQAQDNLTIVKNNLLSKSSQSSLNQKDIDGIVINSSASSLNVSAKHIYFKQTINGFDIVNSYGNATIKEAEIAFLNHNFKHIASFDAVSPSILAEDAIQRGLALFNIPSSESLKIQKQISKYSFIYENGTYVSAVIPIKLCYITDETGNLQLVWDFSLALKNDWWSIKMSATTGEIIKIQNWVNKCFFDKCENEFSHSHSNNTEAFQSPIPQPLPPPGSDTYKVYGLPNTSPLYGDRVVLVNPSDPTFSPFGWHDVNGISGDEFTITRGNNVYASDDLDDDDVPGYSPDGGSLLNFNFGYDSVVGVEGNLNAAITNLFYMNNMMHDIWAYYGFDEESGNFQQTNYSNIGAADDFVFADAQDGSGTNNANFGTPPDGFNPRMQMYLWSASSSDLFEVNNPSNLAGLYTAAIAGFGPGVPNPAITQNIVLVNDGNGDTADACDVIQNSFNINGKIAIVKRGNCNFADKVLACQQAGAVAVIVMNNNSGAPFSMGGGDPSITIPSIMISQLNGNAIIAELNNSTIVNGTIGGEASGNLDSDYDNGVIAHEYGHGISNRLIGGPSEADCLDNDEQMGEGWSDWLGIVMTMKPSDLAGDPRSVGNYVAGQSINGGGIRPSPYSTSFSINNYTYGDLGQNGLSIPHGVGFVWATMLWDLNWALIDQYGFDADLKTGNGGNNKAMALVIEGLKLTMCKPSFIDGRDAILQADELLYNGANQCLIWDVFAHRGLGFSADAGSGEIVGDETEAFDIPDCITSGIAEQTLQKVSIFPNPTKDKISLVFPQNQTNSIVYLVDINGKQLFSKEQNDSKSIELNLDKLSSGYYLLKVVNEISSETYEVVKQ